MIDTVFGIKVKMSGLCINRYRPIIGRLLDADYRLANNRPFPYRCISDYYYYNPNFWHVALDLAKTFTVFTKHAKHGIKHETI